jgi:diguanylate cyclase (GGDEF)-like protein
MGAETVIFDILFLESRTGDDFLADAVKRNKNAVFAISSPVYLNDFHLDQKKYDYLITDLSWSVSPQLPVSQLEMVLLPVVDFISTRPAAPNLGIIDVIADDDNIVRRIPYVYKVGHSYIPSLPVVACNLHNKYNQIKYDQDQSLIMLGSNSWHVDEDGLMSIYFPKNSNSLMSMSFYKIVRAAMQSQPADGDDHFMRGKTVFIGSTAFKSDRVNTPRGMMSGTYLLALGYQNLKYNLLLKPQSVVWNSLWLSLALITLFINVFCRRYCPWRYGLIVLFSLGLLVYGNGLLFALHKQPSHLLMPLLTVVTGYSLYVLFFGVLLKQENVQLLSEKNKLQDVNESLAAEANTDALTGLLNRRAYLSCFDHEIKRYHRTGVSFCVGIMDLDHFKRVNDTYGHDVGDDVLRNCAGVLKNTVRELDVVARWGGEEFVIFFPATGVEGARKALEKIRLAISEQKTVMPGGSLQVTISIGMAQFDDLAMSPERCISKADKALYEAKKSGRNRVCVYQD